MATALRVTNNYTFKYTYTFLDINTNIYTYIYTYTFIRTIPIRILNINT